MTSTAEKSNIEEFETEKNENVEISTDTVSEVSDEISAEKDEDKPSESA